MSVREYIGARYVPLFADPIEWDNTKTYEPLTIVYYQGNSYTSRQAVPTGIAITNTTYWALTGNYNAQIEAYRAEVQEFADDIGELNAALPTTVFDETHTVDARFDDIEANNWVTTARINDDAVTNDKLADDAVGTANIIDGNVTADKLAANSVNSSKIADGSIKASDLEKPIFVLLGDSWSDFANYQNWYSAAHIGDILGCELKNFAVGGAGFIGGNSQVSAQLTTAGNTLTSDEKARVKWVVVNAGVNDFSNSGLSNYSNWLTAIRTLGNSAHSMFPNAQVYYAPNMCSVDNSVSKACMCVSYNRRLLDDLRWGTDIFYIENLPYFFCGHRCNEIFDNGGLHLNGTGARAFGNTILNALLGHNALYRRGENMALSTDSSHYLYAEITPWNVKLKASAIKLPTTASNVHSGQNVITEALQLTMCYFSDQIIYPIWIGVDGAGTHPCWLRYVGSWNFLAIGTGGASAEYYLMG